MSWMEDGVPVASGSGRGVDGGAHAGSLRNGLGDLQVAQAVAHAEQRLGQATRHLRHLRHLRYWAMASPSQKRCSTPSCTPLMVRPLTSSADVKLGFMPPEAASRKPALRSFFSCSATA